MKSADVHVRKVITIYAYTFSVPRRTDVIQRVMVIFDHHQGCASPSLGERWGSCVFPKAAELPEGREQVQKESEYVGVTACSLSELLSESARGETCSFGFLNLFRFLREASPRAGEAKEVHT